MDPKNTSRATADVIVDSSGIELAWRVHFGFFGEVKADQDSDGDGVNDAEEARAWTNPLGSESDPELPGPEERRLKAMEFYRAVPILVDGKVATPAEVLAKEEQEGLELSRTFAVASGAAKARAEAWSRRTGQPLYQGGNGRPSLVVVDAEGDRPVFLSDYGTVSNDFAVVPPLWPGGSVGSNVTGYVGLLGGLPVRKDCGMWEIHAPRVSHQELTGRIAVMDAAVFDPDKSYHATFVSGIIAGAGFDPDFLGIAYGAKISAYNSEFNFSELSSLSNITIRDMRASNHSYGKINGWGPPLAVGGYNWRYWSGDLAFASAASNWEDFRFGHYNSEAATADTTARNKSYHLMVKAAGNDRNDGGSGRDFAVMINGVITGYSWCFTTVNYELVLVEFSTGLRYIKADSVIVWDYTAGLAHIDTTTPIYTTGSLITLPADGNSFSSQPGYDSLAEGFTVAKNALSVGAMADAVTVATYSSAGPTDDGRLKPDIMALGGEVGFELAGLGAFSDNDYSRTAAGTSFAAPAVSGAVTLLSQYQENLRTGKEPLRSSTFKALLCHSADDVGLAGPDYLTGWGIANAQAAAEMIKTNANRRKITEVYLDNGQSAVAKVRAVSGQPIRVTIAWNDPAGPAQPNTVDPLGNSGALKVLKNDLNLKVVQTTPTPSVTHHPYQPNPADPYSPAGFGVNNRDNVEQVYIAYPVANQDYEIQIQQQSGTSLSGGGQWVSVVMTGVTSPGPAELSMQSVTFQPYYGGMTLCSVVFSSVMGGYYKVQYVPHGAPPNSWQDAPIGILYSRGDLCYASFYINPSNPVPVRAIAVSPNPFNLP